MIAPSPAPVNQPAPAVRADQGLTLLRGVLVARLVLILFAAAIFITRDQLPRNLAELYHQYSRWIYLLPDLLAIGAWSMLGAGPRSRPLTRSLVALLSLDVVIALVMDFGATKDTPLDVLQIVAWVEQALWLAQMVLVWLALRALAGDLGRAPSRLGQLYVGVVVARFAMYVVPMLAIASVRYDSPGFAAFRMASFAVSALLVGLLLSVVSGLRRPDMAPPVGLDPAGLGAPPATGNDVVVGALWLCGGLVVSIVSFSMAHGGGGGRYVVTTGAIAYGIARLVRGLGRR